MAMLRLKWAVMLAVLAVAVGTASAAHKPAPAHAPVAAAAPAPAATISPECMDAVLNMSDCLPYVESGSTTKHPDKPCCPELDGLLQSNPVCLCQLLAGGGDSYGVSVDYKRAMALPGVCGLNAPPLSACAAFGVPVGPSSAPLTGVSPSAATGPQMPDNPPSVSPSKQWRSCMYSMWSGDITKKCSATASKSAASSRFTARSLVALAALPLAITAAAML